MTDDIVSLLDPKIKENRQVKMSTPTEDCSQVSTTDLYEIVIDSHWAPN